MEAPAYKEIKVSVDNHRGTITLERPSRGNSITLTMAAEIKQALASLEESKEVRVIVVTGSGRYFCTGMDLGGSNQADMSQQLQQGTGPAGAIDLYERFRNCKKPLIARINGPALGGGWGLVFTADVRIATKESWFWFAEVKRGLVPAIISAYIVPQIGAFRAKEYMLTGKKISAQKAYELGFLSAVVENEQELDAKVNEYVQELLTSAPVAMEDIKNLVNYVSAHSHEDNLQEVEKVFSKMVHSPEALYGMSCFAQKQKPDWASFHHREAKL